LFAFTQPVTQGFIATSIDPDNLKSSVEAKTQELDLQKQNTDQYPFCGLDPRSIFKRAESAYRTLLSHTFPVI
jgi:hypothetical protein